MTLLEVLVALSVGAMVLAGVSEAVRIASTARDSISTAVRHHEREANAHRALAELLAGARTDLPESEFRGETGSEGQSHVSFTSSMADVNGARHVVRVSVSRDGDLLIAEIARPRVVPDTLVLVAGGGHTEWSFLPERGAEWVSHYVTASTLPIAARVTLDSAAEWVFLVGSPSR